MEHIFRSFEIYSFRSPLYRFLSRISLSHNLADVLQIVVRVLRCILFQRPRNSDVRQFQRRRKSIGIRTGENNVSLRLEDRNILSYIPFYMFSSILSRQTNFSRIFGPYNVSIVLRSYRSSDAPYSHEHLCDLRKNSMTESGLKSKKKINQFK